MKRNEGITLVALVITIIVLLILAGVSISLVVGDNGVLNQAQNAKTKSDQAWANSAMELAASSLSSEFMGGDWLDNEDAKIYNYITVDDLDKEIQQYGFKIKTFKSKTPDSSTYIDGETTTNNNYESTNEPKITVIITANKTGTNLTDYKYELTFNKETDNAGKVVDEGTSIIVTPVVEED